MLSFAERNDLEALIEDIAKLSVMIGETRFKVFRGTDCRLDADQIMGLAGVEHVEDHDKPWTTIKALNGI